MNKLNKIYANPAEFPAETIHEFRRYHDFIQNTKQCKSQLQFDRLLANTKKFLMKDITKYWEFVDRETPSIQFRWRFQDFIGFR